MGTHGNIGFWYNGFVERIHTSSDGHVPLAIVTLFSIPRKIIDLVDNRDYYFRYKTNLYYMDKAILAKPDHELFNLFVEMFDDDLWLDISLSSYFIYSKPAWSPNPINANGEYFWDDEDNFKVAVDGSRKARIVVSGISGEEWEEVNEEVEKYNNQLKFAKITVTNREIQFTLAEVFCDLLLQEIRKDESKFGIGKKLK